MFDLHRIVLVGYRDTHFWKNGRCKYTADKAQLTLTVDGEGQSMSVLETAIEGLKTAGFPDGKYKILRDGKIVSEGEYGNPAKQDGVAVYPDDDDAWTVF